MTETALLKLLRHDRLLVITAIAAVTVLAWAYIVTLASIGPVASSAMHDMPGMDMAEPAFQVWNAPHFIFMFAMWSVMMLGMMLPSVTPMVLIYARVARQALAQGKPLASTAWFVGGYLSAWFGFSLFATVAQWVLESTLLLTPMGKANDVLGAVVLILAGLYQWSPLKNHCLSRCHSPLLFLQCHAGFERGFRGSFKLGARHGLYCVGCCWSLMCLLFVAGIMNLLWIAGLAVLVLMEKLIPVRPWFSRLIGTGLILSGVALGASLPTS